MQGSGFSAWRRAFSKLSREVSVYNTPGAHIIRISPLFLDRFKGVKYVKLFYDEKGGRFAIKPLTRHEADAFKVSKASNSNTVEIHPYSFLKRLNVPHGRHPCEWDEQHSMLVIKLQTEKGFGRAA